MHFQSFTVLSLAALAIAAPTPNKRALKIRQSGPVLADTTFNDISIAGGQAGDAEAEALAVFSALDVANPENIDPADIDFLGEVNSVANDAEKEAFNPAVEAATGDEADQIQNGKIKNKVLKLMATKIQLEAKQAQGDDSVAEKLADETKKLENNIATDTKNAGQPSIAEAFDATISGGGNVAAGAGNAAAGDAATGNGTAATEDDAATDDQDATADDSDDATDDDAATDTDDTEDTAADDSDDAADNDDAAADDSDAATGNGNAATGNGNAFGNGNNNNNNSNANANVDDDAQEEDDN